MSNQTEELVRDARGLVQLYRDATEGSNAWHARRLLLEFAAIIEERGDADGLECAAQGLSFEIRSHWQWPEWFSS